MSAPSISVVICAYATGRWHLLVDAVRSVERQECRAAEIIVSVDHNPALAARVRAELPGTVVVENHGPRGLSGARNSGIARAQAEVIAFLDDDAVAQPDWLGYLSRGFDNPAVAGVGGSIEPAWAGGRPGWFPAEFDWVVGCTYRGMPEVPAPVRNLIGANMAFRREVFDAVGGFRSGIGRVGTLPVGCEETELCIRVRQRFPQATMLYEPRARISHHVPLDRGTWRYYARRCYAEGRSKTMVARHVGLADGLANERRYTRQTLPAGVARGLADALRRGDPTGPARALAIAAGLAITTAGFVASQLATFATNHSSNHSEASWPDARRVESLAGAGIEVALEGPAPSLIDDQ